MAGLRATLHLILPYEKVIERYTGERVFAYTCQILDVSRTRHSGRVRLPRDIVS